MKVLREKGDSFSDRGLSSGLETLAQLSRDLENKTPVREFLTGYVNHPKRVVKLVAIQSLGSLRDPKATPVLESFTSNEKDSQIGKAAKEAIDALRKVDDVVPKEVVELRKTVADLKKDNEKLEQSIEEIKSQLKALGKENEDKDKGAEKDEKKEGDGEKEKANK